MFGYQTVYEKSMNGVKTLSDGISTITDGVASHENVIYSDYIKSETGNTQLYDDSITTGTITVDTLQSQTINSTNIFASDISSDLIQTNNLIVNTLGTFNGPGVFNSGLSLPGSILTQTQTGYINQSGTGTNFLKDTSLNGVLTVGSNIVQNGGSTALKDLGVDNIAMRSNKSITQTGTTDNYLGKSTITELKVLTSLELPANVTIAGTTTTDDINMTGSAVIVQDLTDLSGVNVFKTSNFTDLNVSQNFTMTGGATRTAVLKNTTIEGTATIQGDITQTTGSANLKTIQCNNITLNSDQVINFNGTGRINQSTSTGTNNMSAITMNSNANLTIQGSGIISQSLSGQNVFSHSRFAGYSIIGGRNNTTFSHTQAIQNNNGLQLQFNRDNSTSYSYLMNNRTGSGGGFRFQRYNGGAYVDEPLVIDDSITSNKNVVINGSLTCTTAQIGNIDNTEIDKLDGITTNIQTKFNSLDSQIAGLSSSTSTATTALTGITYTAGTDTTLVDNNLTVSKTLLVGTRNIGVDVSNNISDISGLKIVTTGQTYNSGTDTTTIDNNLTVNKTLIVQGMDIKAEIDALETTFTTGTLNSTSAVIADLSSNIIQANTQIRCPNFSVSNGRAIDTSYNPTAISNPVQTHGLGIGTGDGPTLAIFNQAIYSWYGTGFIDTCFKVCNAVINHRTGDFVTNGAITCANVIVNTLATLTSAIITNLTATNITSPSNANINITTASGRNMYINNNKGSASGNVYINTGSTNSHVYIDNGSLTIAEGNLALTEGVISTSSALAEYVQFREILPYPTTTYSTLKTSLRTEAGKVITSQCTYFGVWFIDSAPNQYKLDRFRFVPCSVAVAGSYDDCWIVCPGYKVVLYYYASYAILSGQRPWSGATDEASQTRTLDNTTGTTFLCTLSTDIYGANNQVASAKVYYQNSEITLPYLS